MADLKRLKKPSGHDPLGGAQPPPRAHAPGNVTAPETFEGTPPATPQRAVVTPSPVPTRTVSESIADTAVAAQATRIGLTGGKGRKTGRVHQLGTRFTGEFVSHVHELSEQTGIKINALLEQALAAWERERNRQNSH